MNRKSSPRPEPAHGHPSLAKTFAASTCALLATLAILFVATDSGHSFTTEQLRRGEVAREPRGVPDFELLDARGARTDLHRLLAADGKVWIVDFVYTRCQTVCSALGSVFQQLQQQIKERGLQSKVGLLSISFDPAHDDAPALAAYAERMHLDGHVWSVLSLASPGDRRGLLDAFGIMVIPAGPGEFEHNAALHLVDGRGRLFAILDYAEPGQALDAAVAARRR